MALVLVALFCGTAAFLAYRQRMLTTGGSLVAAIMGLLVLGLGGWIWGLILITFFLSSSALTAYQGEKKALLAGDTHWQNQRAWGQALAKGLVGAGAAVVYFFDSQEVLLAAFLGALATANADTWATELGMLSPRPPRLLTTGRPVAAGTSGAVTALGLAAAAAGGLAIGIVAYLFLHVDQPNLASGGGLWPIPIALVSGLSGALFDSLLGATVQARFYCPFCHQEVETRRHPHQGVLQRVRGWRWLDNNGVNLISTLGGALAGVALYQVWHG